MSIIKVFDLLLSWVSISIAIYISFICWKSSQLQYLHNNTILYAFITPDMV